MHIFNIYIGYTVVAKFLIHISNKIGGNKEKICAHWLFARQKADMPKTPKMAAWVWGVL